MASKRKCTITTLDKKLQGIAEVRNGKSQILVVVTLGVPKSSVGDIIFGRKEKISKLMLAPAAMRRTQRSTVLCGTCTFRSSTIFFLVTDISDLWTLPGPMVPGKGRFYCISLLISEHQNAHYTTIPNSSCCHC